MKILYLSDEFPPLANGGAAIAAYDIAKAVLEKGHEVFVVTSAEDFLRAGESAMNGIKIFTIYSKYHDFWRSYLSVYNPFLAGKIKKILTQIRPDIVHAHNMHSHLSYYLLKLAKKNGAKVFLTAHDTMLISYGKVFFKENRVNYKIKFSDNIKIAGKRYNPLRNIAIKHYLRYVDKIFAISGALRDFLAQNGIESEVLHNGINTELWKKPPESDIQNFKNKYKIIGKKIVFFGGRLSGAKGGWQIIKAFHRIMRICPEKNVVLMIAGKEVSGEDKMKKFIQKNGMTDNVIFTGWIYREEMKTAFFVSGVCVTPSIYFDPFNLTNIEAMAAGKPVVGTCFGGAPEIVIDGETGYIINPCDDELMAKKICDLLMDEKKAESFGRAGKKRVEEFFSISKQADKLIDYYISQ